MGKELLSRTIGIYAFKYADKRLQLMGYNADYPLGKLILYKDHMLISGPFKKIELKYSEIKTFKWKLFVGFDLGGIKIIHNNPKYPKLIGITNGFLGKSLYRDILDVLKENRIKLKL